VIQPLNQPVTQTFSYEVTQPLRPWLKSVSLPFSQRGMQPINQLLKNWVIQIFNQLRSMPGIQSQKDSGNQPSSKRLTQRPVTPSQWRSQSVTVSDLVCRPVIDMVTRLSQSGSHPVNRGFSHLGSRLFSRKFVNLFIHSAIHSICQARIHVSINFLWSKRYFFVSSADRMIFRRKSTVINNDKI
jgi:hypothetical protein